MLFTAMLLVDVAVLCYVGNVYWGRTVESSDGPNPKDD